MQGIMGKCLNVKTQFCFSESRTVTLDRREIETDFSETENRLAMPPGPSVFKRSEVHIL